MAKILNFPLTVQQPVPEPEYIQELSIEDIPDVDEMDYQYEDNQHFISNDKCYKCGKEIDFTANLHEQMWHIQGRAGYGSQLDGSQISICICDTCLVFFLGRDLP